MVKLYKLIQYKNMSQYLNKNTTKYISYVLYDTPKTFFVDLILRINKIKE